MSEHHSFSYGTGPYRVFSDEYSASVEDAAGYCVKNSPARPHGQMPNVGQMTTTTRT